MEVLSYPPYSPDLAPSDYHLFMSLQHFLDGKRFKTRDDVKTNIESFFSNKPEDFYSRGINSLPDRRNNVIENNGTYFLDQLNNLETICSLFRFFSNCDKTFYPA